MSGSQPSARKALSKRTRFEVFKPDRFQCQYCVRTPPAVVLHVDHIIAVAGGGTNDPDNLTTACSDCNMGKSDVPLGKRPRPLLEKAAEGLEREAQLVAYNEVLKAKRERMEDEVWSVFAVWRGQTETSNDRFLTVQRFVDRLGVHCVTEAVEVAMARGLPRTPEFKYFCGICWNRVREAEYR